MFEDSLKMRIFGNKSNGRLLEQTVNKLCLVYQVIDKSISLRIKNRQNKENHSHLIVFLMDYVRSKYYLLRKQFLSCKQLIQECCVMNVVARLAYIDNRISQKFSFG